MRIAIATFLFVLGIILGNPSQAHAQGIRITIISEINTAEYLAIEADGPDSGASFSSVVIPQGTSSVCCIPYPTQVKIYHRLNDTRNFLIGFAVTRESGDRRQTYKVTLHTDGKVSLTVENSY